MKNTTQYIRSENVLLRSVAGNHLLIPADGNADCVYTLNETGYLLWQNIAEAKSEEALVETLIDKFGDLEPALARHDVKLFLNNLLEMDLVKKI